MNVGPTAPPVELETLERMGAALKHRGPDGHGAWQSPDGRVGLVHRRLAILDLSAPAAQPMSNEDGSVWIVYNGEVYNHAALRRELEAAGRRRWRTDHSDTEVVLQAFEEWGHECVERFRGMFAFALWDGRRRQLWLVRDRIGVKPLYWTAASGSVAFASEIKALLEEPSVPRKLDEVSLYHYLTFLAAPPPRTLFAGIQKLAPGSWLLVGQDGKMTERKWWDVWDHVAPRVGRSDEELAAEVLAELRTSVELRKVSDVPVGVFLSGGVDSGTNAALFSAGGGARLRTFSVGYDPSLGSCADELGEAREMAARTGAEHHERRLTQDDLLAFLPEMVWHQDEPIADPVCVPIYYLSKLARDAGVPVCQLGEGSDELFCGYPFWMTAIRLQQWSERQWTAPLQRLAREALPWIGKADGIGQEMLRRAAEGLPVFWSGAEAFTEAQKRRLLHPALLRRLDGLDSWQALAPVRRRFDEAAWDRHPLHWMTYADLSLRLPELLLMRVDKMSMAVGLEGRVPFLDHKLVELVLSIPAEAKTRGHAPKALLKRAVRGVIPDEVIDRPKRGFGVPIAEWFGDRLGAEIRRELAQFCDATEIFDRREVERWLARPNRAAHAWNLYNFALWWKRFLA